MCTEVYLTAGLVWCGPLKGGGISSYSSFIVLFHKWVCSEQKMLFAVKSHMFESNTRKVWEFCQQKNYSKEFVKVVKAFVSKNGLV